MGLNGVGDATSCAAERRTIRRRPGRVVANGRAQRAQDGPDGHEDRLRVAPGSVGASTTRTRHAAALDHERVALRPHAVGEARQKRAHRRKDPTPEHVCANVCGERTPVDDMLTGAAGGNSGTSPRYTASDEATHLRVSRSRCTLRSRRLRLPRAIGGVQRALRALSADRPRAERRSRSCCPTRSIGRCSSSTRSRRRCTTTSSNNLQTYIYGRGISSIIALAVPRVVGKESLHGPRLRARSRAQRSQGAPARAQPAAVGRHAARDRHLADRSRSVCRSCCRSRFTSPDSRIRAASRTSSHILSRSRSSSSSRSSSIAGCRTRSISWGFALRGAAVVAVAWPVVQIAFAQYLTHVDFTHVYGALSAPLVLLLWFYCIGSIFLFGAEYSIVVGDRVFGTRSPNNRRLMLERLLRRLRGRWRCSVRRSRWPPPRRRRLRLRRAGRLAGGQNPVVIVYPFDVQTGCRPEDRHRDRADTRRRRWSPPAASPCRPSRRASSARTSCKTRTPRTPTFISADTSRRSATARRSSSRSSASRAASSSSRRRRRSRASPTSPRSRCWRDRRSSRSSGAARRTSRRRPTKHARADLDQRRAGAAQRHRQHRRLGLQAPRRAHAALPGRSTSRRAASSSRRSPRRATSPPPI